MKIRTLANFGPLITKTKIFEKFPKKIFYDFPGKIHALFTKNEAYEATAAANAAAANGLK